MDKYDRISKIIGLMHDMLYQAEMEAKYGDGTTKIDWLKAARFQVLALAELTNKEHAKEEFAYAGRKAARRVHGD